MVGELSADLDWEKVVYESEHVQLLASILNEWCEEHGCSNSSEAGRRIAADLVEWFELGIREPSELRIRISPAP